MNLKRPLVNLKRPLVNLKRPLVNLKRPLVNLKRPLLAATAAVLALGLLVGVALDHLWPAAGTPVAQGQERPRRPSPPLVVHSSIDTQPHTATGAHSGTAVDDHRAAARTAHPRAARVSTPARSRIAVVKPRRPLHSAPHAPLALTQIGGREPAMRVLAPGTWINSTSFDVVLRMASPMDTTRLQPQVELRRAERPFTGQPTVSGGVVGYSGTPVLGVVHVRGLRDGVSYHWQARVRDTLGPGSAWVPLNGPTGATLRVYLARPAAPLLTLTTPAQPGGWVATRRLTLRWSPPPDGSGIRGYSYTLSRSPRAEPALRLRTGATSVTIPAHGDGLWYFTVRALNYAHSWGAAARLAVRIDTRTPLPHLLSVPSGPVNPARAQPLLRLGLTDWSRVTVDVLTTKGRLLRSIPTHLHGPGDRLAINWDGLDARGTRAVTGHYLLRISAANRAGVTWSATRPLDVESAPPAVVASGFSLPWTYNPYNNGLDGQEVVTATLNEPARVRVEALHDGQVVRSWSLEEKRPGGVLSVTWDGTDGKQPGFAPEGLYTFRASAVDAAGNRATLDLGSLSLDLRRIVVSLDAQQLWALDGNRVLLTTLVTTGGPELPTPTGNFQIIDRESPFTFRSMDPPSSPFWYPPSPTNFALLFQINGYFIHDAPWRSYYGPGSNAVDGRPGSNTTGTHGCVNVPYTPMAWIFNWATMYTPVQVRQHVVPGQW